MTALEYSCGARMTHHTATTTTITTTTTATATTSSVEHINGATAFQQINRATTFTPYNSAPNCHTGIAGCANGSSDSPGCQSSRCPFHTFYGIRIHSCIKGAVLNLHMLPLNGGRCRGRKTQCSGDDRMWPDKVGKTTAISTAAVPRTTEKWACLPHRVRVIMFQRGHIAEIQSFAAVV